MKVSNSYAFGLLQEFNISYPHLVLYDRKHFFSVLTDLSNLLFLFHKINQYEECSYQTVSKNAGAAVRKCSLEAVAQRCSVKKLFVEISQNSQENTCARVSLLSCRPRSATLFKRRPCFLVFPVNFAKFGRTPFLTEHLWWLLLVLQNRCSYKFPDIHQKISLLKSLFDTIRGLKAHNFNKEETSTQVFSCEYHKIFKNSCFIEHPRWLLLNMVEEFLRISNSS